MKPYFKVIFNKIKFNLIRLIKCSNFKIDRISLFNYNTKIVVNKTSSVLLGNKIVSDGRCVIMVDYCANLVIGDNVYFNEGAMISCKEKVIIGSGCRFGPNVKIFDNNHCFDRDHGVLPIHVTDEIIIGKNCWIASNVTILKGTQIGDNCIIGAGCVIKGIIPEKSIVTQEKKLRIKPVK